jgi:tRNA A-37 threonylcarbamoyl transferase component Bud32
MINIEGFEEIRSKNAIILIKPEWKGAILQDLVSDFKGSKGKKVIKGKGHLLYNKSGDQFFVKKPQRRGFFHFLGRLYIGPDRALNELKANERLRSIGLNTCEIIALKISRLFLSFYEFAIVERYLANAVTLLQFLKEADQDQKKRVLNQLARILRLMHDSCIYHRDLNLKNILIDEKERIFFVDLDTVMLARKNKESLGFIDVTRLNRSYEKLMGNDKLINQQDKMRFLINYNRLATKQIVKRCRRFIKLHRAWWRLANIFGI